jgi:dolichol-phosphate mannosyltransferase
LLRLPARDSTAGFKLYSRAASQVVVDESKENRSMGAFEIETIYLAKKHDLTVKEVPITFANREKGKSKAGLHEVFVVLRFVLSHILW